VRTRPAALALGTLSRCDKQKTVQDVCSIQYSSMSLCLYVSVCGLLEAVNEQPHTWFAPLCTAVPTGGLLFDSFALFCFRGLVGTQPCALIMYSQFTFQSHTLFHMVQCESHSSSTSHH